jgi:hypothetical protein
VDFLVSPLGTQPRVRLGIFRLLSNFHLLCVVFRVLWESSGFQQTFGPCLIVIRDIEKKLVSTLGVPEESMAAI